NQGSHSISIINGATNTITTTILVGNSPFGVAVNPSTNTVYVSNSGSNSVSMIDGVTNSVTSLIPVGSNPVGVAVNPSINIIYAVNNHDNSVSVIDDGAKSSAHLAFASISITVDTIQSMAAGGSIPEFGPIALIVLTIAVLSTIVFTAKSRIILRSN